MYIDLVRLRRSFFDAFKGLRLIIQEENTIRIELLIAIFVLIGSFFLPLERYERLIIIIVIFFVVLAEILNTIVERVVQLFDFQYPDQVRKIKQKSAAFVLVFSLMSLLIGFIIFIPYIFNVSKK